MTAPTVPVAVNPASGTWTLLPKSELPSGAQHIIPKWITVGPQ